MIHGATAPQAAVPGATGFNTFAGTQNIFAGTQVARRRQSGESAPEMRTTAALFRLLWRRTDTLVIHRIRKLALKALLAHVSGLVFLFAGQGALAQAPPSISGNVIDSSGAPIFGAVVTVQGSDGGSHMTITNSNGSYRISSLTPGNYNVKISAEGFSDWTASNVPASITPESKPLRAVMKVAPAVTSVTVGLPPEQVAEQQLKQEVKQRVAGLIPNFYVTYEPHPAPLTPRQKLHLGLRTLFDPATFAAAGITAGIQQNNHSFYQYGQGTEGFAKRFGAEYATAAAGVLFTSVLADSVLHQDPRYFYSGKGSTGRRVWYAVKSAFRAKGDNGKWQPPYASLIGDVAAAEITQTYRPDPRTQYTLIGRTLLFRTVGLVGLNLFEEFLLKKLTTHTPQLPAAANELVLHEGTPVTLIVVNGFNAQAATAGQTVTFVLAQDLTLNGKVLARTGDVAKGAVTEVSAGNTPAQPGRVALQHVMLRAGNINIPLRSSQIRGAAGPVQQKQLPGSGRVEVTLFVAENVAFPQNQ